MWRKRQTRKGGKETFHRFPLENLFSDVFASSKVVPSKPRSVVCDERAASTEKALRKQRNNRNSK